MSCETIIPAGRGQVTRAARRASPTGRDLIRLKLENWTSKDGQARSGLKVAAWKVERLGEIGRDKPPAKAARTADLPAQADPTRGRWRSPATGTPTRDWQRPGAWTGLWPIARAFVSREVVQMSNPGAGQFYRPLNAYVDQSGPTLRP